MHIFIKMKKELYQIIEVPEGIEASINGNELIVKGKEGELKREFNLGKLEFNKKDNKITIGNKKSTKTEKRAMNTIVAHIKNMLKGVEEKFEYQLKICFNHFPITIDAKEDHGIIKNFLGEKIPRRVEFPKGTDIDIKKDFITVRAMDKELAGQAAANFEKATKVRNKDRRVFQDGIFITNKAGAEI